MVEDEVQNQPLYSEVKIPKELGQFLRHDTYSLLIKGHTGTGKTTLALSILRELNAAKNCLYISTRVSPEQLYQYYPWIEIFFAQKKKVEITEGSEVEKDHSVFVDGRLDEPGSLFERITNELMDVKAPTIVIDTWDAIGSLMDKESLINNAKVLQTWRERARAKLIFVTETPEDHTFDFLVDGIVELRQRQYNERLVREIFLSKLRGIKITRPLYTFSLNYGFFHSYEHYNPSDFLNLEYFFSPRHVDKNFLRNTSVIPTGYEELDEILGGGFHMGSTVSIELDPHVNAKISLAFLSKVMLNFIASENLLLFQPFERTSLEALIKYQEAAGIKNDLINIMPASMQEGKAERSKPADGAERIRVEIQKIRKKNPAKKILSVLSADKASLGSKEWDEKAGMDVFSQVKSASDLTVFVSRKIMDSRHTPVSEIADVRLSILEIDGTMFLQSEIPWSHLYAIVLQPEREHGIKLEPLV